MAKNFSRIIKKVSKIVLIAFSAAVFCLVALALAIWQYPGLLLNSKTLALTQTFLVSQGIQVQWKTGDLSASSLSFKQKHIALTLEEVCLNFPDVELEGCFSHFEVAALIQFEGWRPRIHTIGPLKIASKELKYREKKQETAKTETKNSPGSLSWVNWAMQTTLKDISITIDNWIVDSASVFAKGRLSITSENPTQVSGLNIALDGTAKLEPQKPSVPWNFSLKVQPEKMEGALQNLSHFQWKGLTQIEVSNSQSEVRKLSLKNCLLQIEHKDKKDWISTDCGLFVKMAFPRVQDLPYGKLLKSLEGKFTARMERDDAPSSAELNLGAQLKLDPLFSVVKDGSAEVSVEAHGKEDEPIGTWDFQADSQLVIKSLQKFVIFLSKTKWPIPEPFSSLTGGIRLGMKGKGKLNEKEISLPFQLTTDLKSQRQVLNLSTEGKLGIGLKTEVASSLSAAMELKDVQLVLPPLDPLSIPRLFPDSRITVEEKPKKKVTKEKQASPPFELALSFKSNPASPVRLVSSLSEEKIPLVLDLSLTPDSEIKGKVEIKPFSLPLFRRNSRIESLAIRLDPDPKKSEVHGRIKVSYVDYAIFVLIDGLLSHPNVHFMSDPPLSEKQVLAVLLFGRSFDALDSEEMRSVGSAQNALADGAVGLASMYALASTPIESIGYDGTSKTFSAKVKLADNTSMTIGTDLAHIKTLGVRRKLGPHWGINTFLESPFLSAERSITTLLEWNWRY